MSDSNPDDERKRLEEIAAKLPGELVSREAAFPKRRQRPKARLPEDEEKKIEEQAKKEAAADKAADEAKPPAGIPEKPKFKVTRSPFAPRIDQPAKEEPMEPLSWGDEDEFDLDEPAAKEPEPEKKAPVEKPAITEPVKKQAEVPEKPAAEKPEPKKAESRPKPAFEVKKTAPEAPVSESKPESPKPEKAVPAKPAAESPKPTQAQKEKLEAAKDKPRPEFVAKKAAPTKLPSATGEEAKAPQAEEAKPAAKKAAPTRLPKPAAAPAPKPKAAPAPARRQEPQEESESIAWIAVDLIAAGVSLTFAVLVFMNMGV